MQLTKEELIEKSNFVISKIREKYPSFKDIDMSSHDPLNAIVLKIDGIRKERDKRWSSAYEEKKTSLFKEGKITGKKTQTGIVIYDSIPKEVSDEIIAFANNLESMRDSDKEVQELVGVESYYDLHKLSEIRSSAEIEFQSIINQRRKDSGENFRMTPEEFRLTEILFRHPELHGKTLEEIVGSEKKIMDKRAEAYKRLRESEERLFPGFLETIDEKSIKPASLDEIKEHHGRSRWGIYGYQFKRYCEKDKEFRSAERAYKGILDQATSGILLDESSRGYDVWKRKAVAFKPNSNFDSPDDIIRHNLAIHLRAVNSDKIFYYRLYKYNALDWHGELHSKGTKILKNISELRNILEKETGMKIVEKWTKDAKDGGSLRLWLKGETSLYDTVSKNMTYDVCIGCGKIFGKVQRTLFQPTPEAIQNTKIKNAIYNTKAGYGTNDFCSERCGAEYHGMDYNTLIIEDMETRESSGYGSNSVIYRIYNKVTNKNYIGKTERNFLQRWGEHFGPTYTNAVFSGDLKEHGIHSFSFEVIEQVSKKDVEERIEAQVPDTTNIEYRCQVRSRLFSQHILEREQYWIDFYDCVRNGYNQRDNFKK